ncbi:MAG: hypothetical protein FJ211_09630 [Ignavibacteria bacterium]|nr:hypothetical protein [Ignavibacteria bacterium]
MGKTNNITVTVAPKDHVLEPCTNGIQKGLDKEKSKLNIEPGSLVRVAKGSQFGAMRLPPPFTYVEDPDNGEFLGLALDNSLKPRTKKQL